VNLGADQKAEPGWLLPLICRRGGVTRNEVGAIRVGPTSSEFQIAGDAARDFALAASRPDPRAPNVVIESSQTKGPRPQYGGDEPSQARRPYPPRNGGEPSQARRPYPPRDGIESRRDRSPRPQYGKPQRADGRAPLPRLPEQGKPTWKPRPKPSRA
jgi:ATP-dependent RNA helicase DeaD